MTPTPMMLVLLLASLLSAGMGCCVVFLWLTRARNGADDVLRSDDKQLRASFDALAADPVLSAEDELAVITAPPAGLPAEDALIDARDRAEKLLEQNESLLLLSRDQSRRIDLLESEVGGLEEQHVKLQRDLASSRAELRPRPDGPVSAERPADAAAVQKQHAESASEASEASAGDAALAAVGLRSVADVGGSHAQPHGELEEVPVLNRRVARRGNRSVMQQSDGSAALDSDLDIDFPALPESELPDRSDETLELFDMTLPTARRDD